MANLLVVDDNEYISELYAQELTDEGHSVSLAGSGFQALEHLKAQHPDLIVLDIAMPDMDGIETMRRIQAIDRVIPVILNTAFATYQDEYATWPANAYVIKSGDLTELKTRIRELLDVFSRQSKK